MRKKQTKRKNQSLRKKQSKKEKPKLTKKQKKLVAQGKYFYYFNSEKIEINEGQNGLTKKHIKALHLLDNLERKNDRKHYEKKDFKTIDELKNSIDLFGRVNKVYNKESYVEIEVLKRLDIETLKKAVQTLNKNEWHVLSYIYYYDLKQAKIAEIMGINQSNISRLHQKIIKKLRHYFIDNKEFDF